MGHSLAVFDGKSVLLIRKGSILYMTVEDNNNRSTHAIRNWFPLNVAAAAITFVIEFVLRIPQELTIIASALVGVLVFSRFLFRSFGVDRERYRRNK
jgi:hypothetical protein